MADYKELLRRAISTLPENNGAARRAVYEKARSALVGQLRAISPPLPARDITQHRLQLEDCIRQVEQEASEAVITLGRDSTLATRPVVDKPLTKPAEPPETPIQVAAPPPKVAPVPLAVVAEAPKPKSKPTSAGMSIEGIIEEAAATSGASVNENSEPTTPQPSTAPFSGPSRRSADKGTPVQAVPSGSNVRSIETSLKAPSFEPRRVAANSVNEPLRVGARTEPTGGAAALRQQLVVPIEATEAAPVETALSSVREVEVETSEPDPSEAEGAIERAIETLDREARGESLPAEPNKAAEASNSFTVPQSSVADKDDAEFTAPVAQRSVGGLTIFLIVFVVLLAGAGGGGYWAWREGYVDLDQMFGQGAAVPETAETTPQVSTPTMDPVPPTEVVESGDAPTGPGNTATSEQNTNAAVPEIEVEDRLEPTPEPVVPTGTETSLPELSTGDDTKTEERLPGADAAVTAVDDPAASVDPAILAGSQSLLLEASADGTSGAVPFSGTVDWSEGVDELGLPTLVGRASIPARNLGVDVTIRKNSDPSLPASHLMEVDFDVNDTFVGGTIANLPGVLLKNEELVPGTPLIGASARVVGNSFLFALSASEQDAASNTDLLESRRWMDLAVVYGTGRNAIITLEKDDAAQALFDKVFASWE